MAIRKSGYVALFDVLGFSERVVRDALHGLDAYIRTVTDMTEPNRNIGTILFSDTVVLYTFDDSDHSFHAITVACSRLFHGLVLAGVPIRGAVSHGDFVRSENDAHGTVIAGRPIIDAHHYESRLQWIGIMLAPSVLEHRQDLTAEACSLGRALPYPEETEQAASALKTLMIQPCSSVPLEDGHGQITPFEGFAIVPIGLTERPSLEAIRESLDRARNKLERLKQLAPEARSQAKYQRSIDWLSQIRLNFVETFSQRI